MNILITGHRGFIGKNLWSALSTEHTLYGYEWGDDPYDLTDIDLVIHLGAISSTTYSDVKQLLLQNYYFTVELLEKCSKLGVDFQFASSASVYGIHNTTFNENDTLAPYNHYAWSKFMVEEYIRNRTFNCKVQVFRYFNVFGPGEGHKGDQASPIHKFTASAADTGVIKVFEGSENYYRDFIPVEKVIDVHKRFFDIALPGTWNVGTGIARSFRSIANEIASKYGATVIEIPMPDNIKSSYQKFTMADVTKLTRTLAQK